jgi:S-formylglutathione hydrolase FrmB
MKKYAILFGILTLAVIAVQCSKRSNPVDVSLPHGLYNVFHFESAAIEGDRMQDYWVRNVLVYTPPGYDAGDTLTPVPTAIDSIVPGDTIVYGDTTGGQQPDSVIIIPPDTFFVYGDTLPGTYYPVLYLLHGYGGDQAYFRGLYGLAETMDGLIDAGEIEPMIVVTPNATNNLGGGFYTNSPDIGGQSYAGRMQDYITDEIVTIIDTLFNTMTDRQHRGIAGHSMGGYGAVKIAMLRNDLFGSASAMSAPLTFYGTYPDTTSATHFLGLTVLFPRMFEENGFVPGDTAAFYRIAPGPGKRLTNMMFGMGSAFSPHDPTNPDTSVTHRFSVLGFSGQMDLPFRADGQIDSATWFGRWLANDVATIFVSGGANAFANTKLYFDCGDADDLGLQYHAAIFDGIATAMGVAHEYRPYSGFDDLYAADHTTYIGQRLKSVLKFHNAAFMSGQ